MGAGPLRGQVPLTALGPEDVLSAAPWNPWNGRLGDVGYPASHHGINVNP